MESFVKELSPPEGLPFCYSYSSPTQNTEAPQNKSFDRFQVHVFPGYKIVNPWFPWRYRISPQQSIIAPQAPPSCAIITSFGYIPYCLRAHGLTYTIFIIHFLNKFTNKFTNKFFNNMMDLVHDAPQHRGPPSHLD